MNLLSRNLLVMFLLLASSLITAAAVVLLEAHTGQTLYGYTLFSYVPVGAIGVGLSVALEFYAVSRVLRMRPAPVVLVAILVVSAGSVFLIDSVEYGFVAQGRAGLSDSSAAVPFLTYSLTNTPLKFWPSGGSSSDDSTPAPAPAPSAAAVSLGNDNNSSVAGIGGGVSGMLATGNALSADNISTSMSGAKKSIKGLEAFGAGLMNHSSALVFAALHYLGFVIGGVLAYLLLRKLAYCGTCSLFLKQKGVQTRYFESSRAMQGAVDQFLTMVKGRQYRQSIAKHAEEGSPEKTKTSSFSSTVVVSRCKGCPQHTLAFRARRKDGMSWKDIDMLGYQTSCLDPINVAG